MLNKVMLIGYLDDDPEIKIMNSSAKVVNFHMATSEGCTDKNTHKKLEKKFNLSPLHPLRQKIILSP